MVKLGALAFGLFTVVAQVSAQQVVKVMPFGASIVSRCWRANLQAKLRNDKTTNFDFVGTQSGTCGGTTDQEHEGHPGSLATDYAKNGNLTVWLNANPPDVIIMLLGTNDVLIGKKSTYDVLAAYDVLIGQMRAKNPKMRIIFSNLLPLDPARWPQTAVDGIVTLNNAIKQYAPNKNTRNSPVVFVDNYSGFDAVADTADGEHPNDAGNEKMATKFFAPTRDAIKAIAPTANGTDSSSDPKANAQAQADQNATPTLVTSSTMGSAQSMSTAQATSTIVAFSNLASGTAQLQTTSTSTSDAKPTVTQGSQKTSSASRLRASWPINMWRSLRWANSRGGSRQLVLSNARLR